MSQKRHRHFVALPLALFVFVLLGVSSMSLRASSVLPAHADRHHEATDRSALFSVGTGASLLVMPHSSVSVDAETRSLSSLRGSFFLSSSSLTALHLSCDRLFLLRSMAYVSVSDTTVTIFALHGSAYIVPCSGEPIYLAEGQQFQRQLPSNTVRLGQVPSSWALEHRSSLQQLPLPSSLLPLQGTFPDDIDRYVLLKKLAQPSSNSSFSLPVLRFSSHEDLSFLLAFLEEVATEHLQLSDALLSWWNQTIVALASRRPDDAFSLLRQASLLPAVFARADYPLQQERWQKALLSLLETLRPFFSSEQQAKLPDLHSSILLVPSLSLSSSSSSLSSASRISSDDLLVAMHSFLRDANFLLMSTSHFSIDVTTSSVRVSSVLRSEQSRDVVYDFLFDLQHKRLSSVRRDGVLLPNDLPFSFFLSKKDHSEE